VARREGTAVVDQVELVRLGDGAAVTASREIDQRSIGRRTPGLGARPCPHLHAAHLVEDALAGSTEIDAAQHLEGLVTTVLVEQQTRVECLDQRGRSRPDATRSMPVEQLACGSRTVDV